jgi:putative ABC transport system permease protein
MASLFFDLRDAMRGLRRDIGYSFTVVLTLALTIGSATAVFSIVDGVLLKPLAYRESHRLVSLKETWRQFAQRASSLEVNEQHFEFWRTHARGFESLAQYIVLPANLTGAGEAAQILVARASGSLFDVLRVPAALGRTLEPADEPSDRPNVMVITNACWRQRFGSDPRIVGRAVVVDGTPRTIVGVLGADFRLPTERLSIADAFVPIHMDTSRVGWEGDHNDEAIGRLRAGVTPEQAQAELDVLQAEVSEIATREAGEPVTLGSLVAPLAETLVAKARRGLLLLLGAVGAVLLIACSNLANLSMTRTLGRLREAAVRSALGASRARLVSRAAMEQLLLAGTGGTLGVAVTWGALQLFVRTAPIDLPRVNDVAIDARVLAFAAIVSILAGALVAVVPAWRTAGRDIEHPLRVGALTTTSDRAASRTRAALLALQVALSVTLLITTALLGASFARLMNVDRGFIAENVLLVPVSMPANRYETEAARQTAYDRMIDAVSALPAVVSASAVSVPPLTGSAQVNGIQPEGSRRRRSEEPSANFRFVGTGFFRALGISILRGRPFTELDRGPGRTMPAVISEGTAKRLWPNEDALGKRFSRGIPGEAGFEVVGIVADIRLTSLERTPPLMVYLPYWWRTRSSTSLVIKSASDPSALMLSVRRAVRQVDPEIAIGDARPLEQFVEASVAARRYQAELFVAFGIVALFIATLGVYAVTSYGVSRRRREMNIRVALGAEARHIRRMIVGQSARPLLAGVGAGITGAIALGGAIRALLFEVRPRDPIVIIVVTAIVAAVGLLASLLAVRSGLSIDPAAALRQE